MDSFPNFAPVCCSISCSNCCFLTWIQASQETGKVVWYSHFFKNFPQLLVTHTVKGFDVVTEAEIDVFLKFSWFFCDLKYVGNLISGFSAFSKSILYIWQFSIHVLLKPNLNDFEFYLASTCNEYNGAVVWIFFGIVLLQDWNENWSLPAWFLLLSFPNLQAYWMQHFHSITIRVWNSSAVSSTTTPLAFFIVMLSKTHLTLNSRMSCSRWVITPSWLSGSLRTFLYSSVYSCHLFKKSSTFVRSISFLSFIVPFFAWNVPLAALDFLEQSLVFPILLFFFYFFALFS